MKHKIKRCFKIFYDAGNQTIDHDGIEHAGYLAFLALLSMFPSLIFFFSIAAGIGRADFGGEFITEIYRILPKNIGAALAPRIDEILSGPPQGLITIAIIGIIWTASSAVEGLRTILNRAYRVKNPPRYIFRRLLSIFQFVILIFVLTIAMFFLTVAPAITGFFGEDFWLKLKVDPLFELLRFFGSSFILFLVVSLSYYILPNIRQSFLRVWPGAAVVVFLWIVTVKIFTFYVTHYPQITTVYGSLAGIILTLIFFYVMSVIYIYGAEFNYFLEKEIGFNFVEKVHVKKEVKKSNS